MWPTARPSRLGILGWVTLYARGLDADRAGARPRVLPLAGLPVSRAAGRCGLLLVAPLVPVQPGADRPAGGRLPRAGGGALPLVRRARQAAGAGLREPRRRHLLAADRPVLRGPAALRERQALRAAAAADRDHHDPRPAPRDRLPLRRHLPERAAAARRGPARGGRARCWRRASRRCPTRGGCARTSASSTTCSWTTPRPRRRILLEAARESRAPPSGCARWRRTSLAKGGDRDGLAPDVDARCSSRPRRASSATTRASRLQILDSLDRGRRPGSSASVEFERRHGRRPARLEELRGRRPVARAAGRRGERAVRL